MIDLAKNAAMKGKNEKVIISLERKAKKNVKEPSPSEALDKIIPFNEQLLKEQEDKLREMEAKKG